MAGTGQDQKLAWAVAECREQGMRKTRALEELLRELVERDAPATFPDLASSPRMAAQCDKATVYRLLMRLEESSVVRRLGSHGRSSYFFLKCPGEHFDYLICSECGTIEKLDIACPVEELEAEIARTSGYRKLYHELEFFGICPTCG